MSGEIVVGFLKPTTVLTAVGIMMLGGLLVTILGLIATQASPWIVALLGLFMFSMIFSRFVISAAYGNFYGGLLNDQCSLSDSLMYAARHVCLLFMAFVPVVALIYVGIQGGSKAISEGLNASHLPGDAYVSKALIAGGFSGVLFATAAVIAISAPILTAIIAGATQNFNQLLEKQYWLWLYTRRGDLGALVASGVGGLMVFIWLYFIPLVILGVIGAGISDTVGAAIGVFISVLPAAATPILMGRLCGAFIAGQNEVITASGVDELEEEVDTDDNLSADPNSPSVQAEVPRVDSQKIDAATLDLSDDFIVWLRTNLSAYPLVESLYLYERNNYTMLGLFLEEGAPLGAQQKVVREFTSILSNAPGFVENGKVELISAEKSTRVKAVGLKLYQKKA